MEKVHLGIPGRTLGWHFPLGRRSWLGSKVATDDHLEPTCMYIWVDVCSWSGMELVMLLSLLVSQYTTPISTCPPFTATATRHIIPHHASPSRRPPGCPSRRGHRAVHWQDHALLGLLQAVVRLAGQEHVVQPRQDV